MICIRHKSLIALVTLILIAAVLLNPAVASARPRGVISPSSTVFASSFMDMLLNWILKAGWGMDPNGNPLPCIGSVVDAGWGMDPNGGV
ncbi:MAG TPA: hypothetical protein VH988_14235 [Thermoanaerobaculia bacterium]|jgi:hypothetical protein|nr:hypothetical protein [Thermoanaerobaculia bacterium]